MRKILANDENIKIHVQTVEDVKLTSLVTMICRVVTM